MAGFFVSYNENDVEWARWITWTLDHAGYTTIFQERDFRPGENFALQMHEALEACDAVIAVLSANYLAANYTYPEWAWAFANDPKGTERKLIPVRVSRVKPSGLLMPLIYIDIVGLPEKQAERKLIDGVKAQAPTAEKPTFPGAVETSDEPVASTVEPKPAFPGPPPSGPIGNRALFGVVAAVIVVLLGVLFAGGDWFPTTTNEVSATTGSPTVTATTTMTTTVVQTDTTVTAPRPITSTTETHSTATTPPGVQPAKRDLAQDLVRLDTLLGKPSLTDEEETEADTLVQCLDSAQSKIADWKDWSDRIEGKRPGTLNRVRNEMPKVTPCY